MRDMQSNSAKGIGTTPSTVHPSGPDHGAEYISYVREQNELSEKEVHSPDSFIACDDSMLRIKELIKQIGSSSVSVLISGESGTGKEIIAKFIHDNSDRREKGFVAVNCAALPPSLLESELFGFEKGAFTGANHRHVGKFELASGGTLLLDEITEIETSLQAKLLRAIQEQEIERIGGRETIKINTRIIATSNRNLKEAVAKGTFREDLYYRLQVLPIEVPPLRERSKDIRYLALSFTKRFGLDYGKPDLSLTADAINCLLTYTWPGNVRELQNTIHRIVLMAQGNYIDMLDLPDSIKGKRHDEWVDLLPVGKSLESLETQFILETLKYHHGNRTHTAKTLGISIRTLRNKINEFTGKGLKVIGPEGE